MQTRMKPPTSALRARGLTLIELLVAVTIFAILSGMAYRALTVVLESRGRIEQENRKWRDLAVFFTRLEQDIAAVTPRPIRVRSGAIEPAFLGNATDINTGGGALVLTRTALAAEPAGVAPPQRVGYRLRAGAVELLTWNTLDQGPRDEPRVVAVLRDVKSMDLTFLDQRGQRHPAWPPASGGNSSIPPLPAGVEVGLTLASGERITRLMATFARPPQ